MTPSRRCRRCSDEGTAAIAEVPLGMLLVVPAAMIGITIPTWFERHTAARAAADEAARAVVLANDWGSGTEQAQAAVDEIAAAYNLEPGDLTLQLDGTLERGADVTAHITITIPAVDLPLVGEVGSLTRTLSHTETVDQFRDFPGGFSNSEGSSGSNSGVDGP